MFDWVLDRVETACVRIQNRLWRRKAERRHRVRARLNSGYSGKAAH